MVLQDDSLMSTTGMEEQASKLDQQQQFGRTTVNSGKFADMPITFDLTNSNTDNPLVTDANLASTSKAAAAAKDINNEQQQQQQQQQAMAVAKYTGDNGNDSRITGL